MPYTPLPNPWTGIPLVGVLIDAIQDFLANDIYNTSGSFFLRGDQGVKIYDDGTSAIEIKNDHSIEVTLHTGTSITVQSGGGTDIFRISNAGEIFMPLLPTSAGTAGSLWNDSGTVKIA